MTSTTRNTKQKRGLSPTRSVSSLFGDARLIHPQLKQLEIHQSVLTHHEAMGCPVEYQIAAQQTSEAITNPELVERYLAMTPLVVIRADSSIRRWQVVSRVTAFYLARIHLAANMKVAALVIPTPSASQLEQILAQDYLVNPILEQPVKQRGRLWAYKNYLERSGILTALGLEGISKSVWAKWLSCSPRSLREEE